MPPGETNGIPDVQYPSRLFDQYTSDSAGVWSRYRDVAIFADKQMVEVVNSDLDSLLIVVRNYLIGQGLLIKSCRLDFFPQSCQRFS